MNKEKKLGEGTYGIVYSSSSDSGSYAVKRNIIDPNTDFLGSIKELDILGKIKGHPYLVELNSVSFGSPFKPGILSPIKDERKDDGVHFIFEKANFDGGSFIVNKCFQYIHFKLAMVQILLGVEYLHGKGIVHRDLKPANFLCFMEKNGRFKIKICDFGLSKHKTVQGNQSPRVITAWYRPPEVVLGNKHYTDKVDVWSLGCIFYEMISKRALYGDIDDDNDKLIKLIFNRHPTEIRRESINIMAKDYKYQVPKLRSDRASLKDMFNLSADQIAKFEDNYSGSHSNTGTYDQFIDLLTHMLAFDPNDRYSITQVLNHDFFARWRQYINTIRHQFPPTAPPSPVVSVQDIPERQWAVRIACTIFNNRNQHDWYKHRIIFQSINMYDRYLDYLRKTKTVSKGIISIEGIEPVNAVPVDKNTGTYLSKHDAEARYLTCLYISIKYFSPLVSIIPFTKLAHHSFTDGDGIKKAGEFEIELIRNILTFNIYQSTIFEAADWNDHRLTDIEVRDLLKIYCDSNLMSSYDGKNVTFGDIYQMYLKGKYIV